MVAQPSPKGFCFFIHRLVVASCMGCSAGVARYPCSKREDGFGEGLEIAEDASGSIVERSPLGVHDEDASARLQGDARKACGRKDRQRRAENKEDVRPCREITGGRKRRFRQHFAEECDVRLVGTTADATRHLRGGIVRKPCLQGREHLQDLVEALLIAAESAVMPKG